MPSPTEIVIDEKQSENEKYFSHFGSVINNAMCTGEIKSRFAMTQAAFKKKKKKKKKKKEKEEALFTNKLDLNFRKKRNVLHLEHIVLWCRYLDISDSISELPGKF